MKKSFISVALIILVFTKIGYSQNMGISDDGASFTPASTSVLELKSTSRGVLVPRMTTAQRTVIGSPATGLMVYDTDTKSFWYYDVVWKNIGSSIQDTNGDTKIQVKTVNEDKIHFDTFGAERIVIDNAGITQMGTPGTNYTKIEADGSLSYEGTATVFDDLTVPVTASKTGGTQDPDFYKLKDNGAGSQGVFLYWFDKTIEEELYFIVQMPHKWKVGSNLSPHVHWVAPLDLGGTKVVWALEYTWVNLGDVFGNTSILSASDPIASVGAVTANKQVVTSLGTIPATGHTLSSVLVCRVFRKAADVADTFGSDAGLLQIDFHYEIDSDGSRSDYSK